MSASRRFADCVLACCSENTLEFRKLRREWPFPLSEHLFLEIGVGSQASDLLLFRVETTWTLARMKLPMRPFASRGNA